MSGARLQLRRPAPANYAGAAAVPLSAGRLDEASDLAGRHGSPLRSRGHVVSSQSPTERGSSRARPALSFSASAAGSSSLGPPEPQHSQLRQGQS